MASWYRLALAILACYRLAQMVALDDGPYRLFERVRLGLGKKAAQEQASEKVGVWTNLSELVNCPFCLGIWFGLVLAFFVGVEGIGGFIVTWLAIAGGQALLEVKHNAE